MQVLNGGVPQEDKKIHLSQINIIGENGKRVTKKKKKLERIEALFETVDSRDFFKLQNSKALEPEDPNSIGQKISSADRGTIKLRESSINPPEFKNFDLMVDQANKSFNDAKMDK